MKNRWLAAVLVTACGGDVKPVVQPAPVPVAPAPAVDPAPPSAPAPAVDDGVPRTDDGTLLLEGTPAIPDALRAEVSRYLDTRSASLDSLADDGRSMLISTRFGETSQIHKLVRPGGARQQITFRSEPVRAAVMAAGGKAMWIQADIGGNEMAQIYRVDLTSGETTMLTDGKSRNEGIVRSRDGKHIAYRSTARNGVDFDIWTSDGVDPTSARMVAQATGWWYPLDWSNDGKKLLVGQYVSITDARIHLVDVATAQVTRLSPEPAAQYSRAVFSRDGKKVYVTSDREGEFTELYETDPTGARWKPLTRSIPWDIDGLAMSSSGRYLAFVANEGGVSVVYQLDTRTGRAQPIKAIPRGVIRDLSFARKAEVLGFSLSSATSTGDAYTYDLRTRKLSRWTESEMGGLDPRGLVEPTLIEFDSFDKVRIPAFYYRPKGAGPFPVIVSIHGGPESQARPYFSAFSQYMVSKGYAVIYPNVRGSTGYGKTYTLLDNGMKREDSVKDIGALLDWVGAQKELDAGRVGVIGGSYGGYMVLASLMHYSKRIKAGVDVVGISNFVTFLENTADYRRDLRRAEYGDERDPAMRKHQQAISPANHPDKLESALFVAQGANDPRVPASEAEQIVKAVRKAGKPVWYMLARNEGHGFAKKSNRDTYLLLSILFFQTHL